MICIENKATLMAQNVFNSARFIKGCTSYKAESIAYHEKSAAHLLAQQCHKAKIHPEKTPATKTLTDYVLTFVALVMYCNRKAFHQSCEIKFSGSVKIKDD